MIIPLNGKGNCTLDASKIKIQPTKNNLLLNFHFISENMNIKLHSTVSLYEKDGYKYYNVTNTDLNFSLSGLKVNLENLFNGLKELGIYL